MSKSTSVVPRAGAPRVLVYVADPRQIDGAAAGAASEPPPLPPPLDRPVFFHEGPPGHAVYQAHHDRRNHSNALYYKPFEQYGDKVNAYTLADNDLVQRTEFFPVNQQFLKETCVKIDDGKVGERPNNGKRDCAGVNGAEYGRTNGQFGSSVETGELVTYQSRCSGPGTDIMPPMQSVAICQGTNQLDTCGAPSEGTIRGDRDLPVGKSYVNYQILEQSVSHQSIVNQSISILNQQVGVSRGVLSEGETGPAPLVLAVVPPADADAAAVGPRTHSEPHAVTVPLGWRRIISGTSVIYVSPSGTALSNLPQLREYLQTSGTCKCGLPCPLRPETAFSFDYKVASKPYAAGSGAELTKLCNHKRKLLATLQAQAHSPATPPPPQPAHAIIEHKKVPGTEVGVLKKKMKKRPVFPNIGVPQMMVQRERTLNEFKPQDNELGRTISPGMMIRQSPSNNIGGNCQPPVTPEGEAKGESSSLQQPQPQPQPQPQRAHYLTVSSGWISQHEGHTGTPVIGANGQLIGLNTAYRQPYKTQASDEYEHNKEPQPPPPPAPTAQQQPCRDDESQIYCGLNQPLTPEVMQKINEQQQIFIQQNQKQIEMAMKGLRAQLADGSGRPQGQPQGPAAQVLVHSGGLVKASPAKTPPWQVKRTEAEEARVPPLQQHYGAVQQQQQQQQWAVDPRRRVRPAGRAGVRPAQGKRASPPSFMEDPSGYLAQQTALLHDTIARPFDEPAASPCDPPDSSDCCRGCAYSPAGNGTGADSDAPIQAGTVSTSRVEPPSPSPTRPFAHDAAPADSPGPHGPHGPHGPPPRRVTQVMHFISNHNVNKNLMEVDNIAMVGVRPTRPQYCPPPHLGGGPAPASACHAQALVTTMASPALTRDTVTSVVAGRAAPATTSINASQASAVRRPPASPTTHYAIPPHRPDPFLDSVALPTSYPLHIAGTTAQSLLSAQAQTSQPRRATPSQILISSTGQLIVSSQPMPPPPPKAPAVQTSCSAQAQTPLPVPPLVNHAGSTVVVQAPFVLQQPVVVDGQVVQQGAVLPQLMTGMVPGQAGADGRAAEGKGPAFAGPLMVSPEGLKKRAKKKKSPVAGGVLQIAPPPPAPNIVVHSSPQQFSPRGAFQLSPTTAPPVLQALTIVPGKQGQPAHILMNGQPAAAAAPAPNGFASQQINLLQPVNLVNNATFPFHQLFVPNLGGVVMTADGAGLVPEGQVQLQLQPNVLAPLQHQVCGGVVIRTAATAAAQQQGKMMPPQHSPTAQFLSPPSQVVVNGGGFGSQLSPLLAGLSPPGVPVRETGPALVVPLSPKRARPSSTYVQQNTTIVQQQTTLVSNNRPATPPHLRHSVSTQTLLQQQRKSPLAGSPPDTTTHSPLGANEPEPSPRRQPAHADTTTDDADASSSAMVQCVSSSEPDDLAWPQPRNDFAHDNESHNMIPNVPMMRQNRTPNPAENTDLHYNQTVNMMNPPPSSNHNQQNSLPINTGYYERSHSHSHGQQYKRKNDFGDGSSYRTDKIMRTTNGMVHGTHKQTPYFSPPTDEHAMHKTFDAQLGSGDDAKSEEDSCSERVSRQLRAGDLVWGPARGHASWPGTLVERAGEDAWRVRWFGLVGPRALSAPLHHSQLLSLSEGLEAHHAESTRHRKSRKLNTLLENAIQEAMAELDRQSERGPATAEDNSADDADADTSTAPVDAPRRKRHDRLRKDKHHKKSSAKLAPSAKAAEGARLRSAR